MTVIGAASATPGSAHLVTRDEFFAGEAKADQLYDQHLAVMKTFETLSKTELKASPDPWAAMMHLKLSDHERSILAEVAHLNGWSRQGAEGFYKLYVADPKSNVYSIGDFLKVLTEVEPGYFNDDGGHTLGLHEADRRRLMGLPPLDKTSAQPEIPADEVSDAETPKKSVTNDRMKWVATSLSKKLTTDETLALSQAAKLNGWGDESAAAAYKMYLAENSNGSLQSFLQLLAHLEPDAYGKNGGLDVRKDDDDQRRLLHVEV